MLEDVESPQSVPALQSEPTTPSWNQKARAPAQESHADRKPGSPAQLEEQQTPEALHTPGIRGLLRRRPVVSAVGAMLLAAAVAGGYLYMDYARHFESTDDAFIAARQFSIAPKVSGDLTAVPVTDNQHVAAGEVIARIDDRDYRTALEQAEAQVAAAKASIQNIDAQLDVQRAQISANQAQVDQAQAAGVTSEAGARL